MSVPALQKVAEMLLDGDGPGLVELLAVDTILRRLTPEEQAHLRVIVRWAFIEEDELKKMLEEDAHTHPDNSLLTRGKL